MLRRLANLTIIILILINCECMEKIQPMGSILFEDHGYPKNCFVQNDIAALSTKYQIHQLLPKNIELMNDDGIMAMIKYFYGINEIIEHMNVIESRQLVQQCFYDSLGGYLKHLILPIAKYSFYAGNISLSAIQKVTDLFERCKELLDTNGNLWTDPITDFSKLTIKILPISIPSDENDSMKACASVITNADDDVMIPLPKMENYDDNFSNDNELSTILRLPFKRDQSYFNINSKKSAFVLFRYYVMSSQCFTYQGIDQSNFNRRLKMWINENVLQYLDDDELYPAFGAVLRIIESIKDTNDVTYKGSKDRKLKKPRERLSAVSSNLFNNDADEFSFDDKNRDVNWWLNAVLVSIGLFILFCLIVYLFIRICCNRKRIKDTEGSSKKGKSLKERISNALHRNTHFPDNDEYYEYKKIPKSIKFENEKTKKKLKGKKEKFQLPRLNPQSDSDSEIVLHESASSKNTFKISEESDDESKDKKISRFLTRMRSKSPRRKNHRDKTAVDSHEERR